MKAVELVRQARVLIQGADKEAIAQLQIVFDELRSACRSRNNAINVEGSVRMLGIKEHESWIGVMNHELTSARIAAEDYDHGT